MCLALYIAVDHPIHAIPWLSEHPHFHVSLLGDEDSAVRAKFSFSNVFYVGAHTGYACGFTAVDEPDAQSQHDSFDALVSFVRRTVALGNAELFLCWEGEQDDPPKHVVDCSVAELRERFQWFAERSFDGEPSLMRVSRSAA